MDIYFPLGKPEPPGALSAEEEKAARKQAPPRAGPACLISGWGRQLLRAPGHVPKSPGPQFPPLHNGPGRLPARITGGMMGHGLSHRHPNLPRPPQSPPIFFFLQPISMPAWHFLVLLSQGKVCACSITQSCLTPCDPVDSSPAGFSVHGISQAKYWSGLRFLLQGIYWAQGSNPHFLRWQADPLPLSHLGSSLQRGVPFYSQASPSSSTPRSQPTGFHPKLLSSQTRPAGVTSGPTFMLSLFSCSRVFENL